MNKKTSSFDATTKTFYGDLFKRWGLEVETEREIFSQSRSIDLVVTCHSQQQKELQASIFHYFRELNAIELKGYNDPLTVKDFNRIMMRAWGLGAVNFNQTAGILPSRLPNRRTLTIVCVSRPKKILDDLASVFHFQATAESGIYHASGQLEIWLIHPSELSLCKKNYPLLALARGEKLAEFIQLCVQKGLTHYLELILYIGFVADPETIWQKILEVYEMKYVIHDETWPIIDEFFRKVPHAMGKLVTFQDALMAKLQEGVQQGQQEDKQQVLMRQLQLKFKSVSDDIQQTIKQTHDTQQLDAWLDAVIIVNSIDDIDFTSAS